VLPVPFVGNESLEMAVIGWICGFFLYLMFISICRKWIKDDGLTKGNARIYLAGLFLIPPLVAILGLYVTAIVFSISFIFLVYVVIYKILHSPQFAGFVRLIKAAELTPKKSQQES
jgi:hypothetical protein